MSNKDEQIKESSVEEVKQDGAKGQTSQKTDIKISRPYLEIIIGDGYGDNPFGHASLRVVDPANKKHVIYDFGRYRATKPLGGSEWDTSFDSANMQLNKLNGEGILRVHDGEKKAKSYMNNQSAHRDSRGYVYFLKEQEVKNVFDHFEKLIKSASDKTGRGDHIIEDWTPTHNCATVTFEGARASGKFTSSVVKKVVTSFKPHMPKTLENMISIGTFGKCDEKRKYPKQ